MIYISCSEEEYEAIVGCIDDSESCFLPNMSNCVEKYQSCEECARKHIKRIKTDITPDTPNYKTEAENTAFLQGFNVAVKKMRGES